MKFDSEGGGVFVLAVMTRGGVSVICGDGCYFSFNRNTHAISCCMESWKF